MTDESAKRERPGRSPGEYFTLIAVLGIAGLNCVALFVISLFAVGGDGSSDGITMVQIAGFGWISLATIFSLYWCSRKVFGAAILAAALTLPLGLLASLAGFAANEVYEVWRPNTSEFQSACKSATVSFISTPSLPITSIAYDWAEGKSAPQYNHFTLGSNGRIGVLKGGTGHTSLPPQVAFTETKCCRYEGPPGNGMKYIREPRTGSAHGITELTADALVTFRSQPIGEQSRQSRLMQFDVDVTDRRDGKHIAALRYFLDVPMRRGCGETVTGAMDEHSFVLKALGLD